MKFKVDSPYCWLQAISGFLFHAVFFGVSFSFGIFYVALLQEFPGRESEAGELYIETICIFDSVVCIFQVLNLCIHGVCKLNWTRF